LNYLPDTEWLDLEWMDSAEKNLPLIQFPDESRVLNKKQIRARAFS
jgi:hypothetical protein